MQVYMITTELLGPPETNQWLDLDEAYTETLEHIRSVECNVFRAIIDDEAAALQAYWNSVSEQALDLPETIPPLAECIRSMGFRLKTAYTIKVFEEGDSPDIWNLIDNQGKEKDEYEIGHLRWYEAWNHFLRKLDRHKHYRHLRNEYENLFRRLQWAVDFCYNCGLETIFIEPPHDPLPDLEGLDLGREFADEAEVSIKEYAMRLWDAFVQDRERRQGRKGGKTAKFMRAGALARQNGVGALEIDWPPPPTPPPPPIPTAQRPMPQRLIDDPNWATHEARRIGSDSDASGIDGIWTFMHTLGVGGFGHAGKYASASGHHRLIAILLGLWAKYDRNGIITNVCKPVPTLIPQANRNGRELLSRRPILVDLVGKRTGFGLVTETI